MHFSKKFVSVIILCMLTAVFFAYSLIDWNSEDIEESSLALLNHKETIRFWYGDETLSDYVSSAAVAFGEANNVRVLPYYVAESDYLEAINRATLSEGTDTVTGPDVYLISHDLLEKAYLAGLAVPIEDRAGVVNEAHFPQAALSAVTYQGKLVAYPLYYETSALLYNETYLYEWARQQAGKADGEGNYEGEEGEFEELEELPDDENSPVIYDEETLAIRTEQFFAEAVPATVSDILQMADTFDPPESVSIFSWDVSDIFYNYYFVGNYMNVGGEAGDDRNQISVNNQEAIDSLRIYQGLNQFFSIDSSTVSYTSVLQDFLEGKLVFTIATTDAAAALAKAKEEGSFAYDYGVALIPDPSDTLEGRSMSVTSAVAVNGYSRHRELANAFAAFLVNDYADNLYEHTGKASANRNVNQDNGALQIFLEEYESSMPLPKLMEASNYWIQLEVLFAKVWNGDDISSLVQQLDQQMRTQIGEH
ncbi:MAG: extracellular solute-binding protein [bacterium]|nr:extracellular solute-binding protein [bacterium]MCM1375387.1 extracellular solute-binding protein [Muribaculum sp.]